MTVDAPRPGDLDERELPELEIPAQCMALGNVTAHIRGVVPGDVGEAPSATGVPESQTSTGMISHRDLVVAAADGDDAGERRRRMIQLVREEEARRERRRNASGL